MSEENVSITSPSPGAPPAPPSCNGPKPNRYTTFDNLLEQEAQHVIEAMRPVFEMDASRVTPYLLKNMTCENASFAIREINFDRPKGDKLSFPKGLHPIQIAMFVLAFNHVYNINCNEEGLSTVLGIYMTEGEFTGTYRTDIVSIRKVIRQYNSTLTPSEVKTVIDILEERAPIKDRCNDPNLIPVNNGIFDFEAKKLLPFTPDLIFMSKSKVKYIPNPANPVIIMPDGVPWDVESWMGGLSDDPEIVQLLWEVTGAVIRTNIDWGQCVMPYAISGCNGKGTFCTMLRGLCGRGTCTSVSILELGQRFQIESIVNSSAIIADENAIGGYLDDAANFKAIITHDPIGIDRKNRPRIDSYQFTGLMVQCLNELPKIRDRTGSLYRRVLLVPFSKCYTGKARPYIKKDYLKRTDVLEYVLHKVLHMDYDKFSQPAACLKLLDQYKIYNDSIQEFWIEFRDQFVWSLLPWDFLFDLYSAWQKRTNPSGKPQSKSSFKNAVREIVNTDRDWMCYTKPDGTDAKVRPGKYIKDSEPLIGEYNLYSWRGNLTLPNFPYLKAHYTGLLRITAGSAVAASDND